MDVLRPAAVVLVGLIIVHGLAQFFHTFFKDGLRFSLLKALILLGILTWAITEVLSALRGITLIGVTTAWSVVLLVALWLIFRHGLSAAREQLLELLHKLDRAMSGLPRGLMFILAYLTLITAILGVIAFVAPPNSSDSMTYHMSRVMHWQQNHNLDFYPTGILRQLAFGPMAEIEILNLQILAGSDRLANLVQFLAMIGCVIGATLITKALGGKRYAQFFSALAVSTIPMGILQSTGTLNDYVVALWLVCFTVFALTQISGKTSTLPGIFAGASLGLALNTKATAYLFAAPIGMWLAFALFKRERLNSVKKLAVLLSVTAVVLLPQSIRNYNLFSNPMGYDYRLTNDLFSAPAIISNVVRNLAIHAAVPIPGSDELLQKGVIVLHRVIGLDVNDTRTTWEEKNFFVAFNIREDLAGNPGHLFLFILAIPVIVYKRKPDQILYSACLTAGFLLYCTILKWQPWGSRLQLPLFVLAIPVATVALSHQFTQRYIYFLMIFLALTATPYLFLNPFRPLAGQGSIFRQDRMSLYFAGRPAQAQYIEVMDRIRDLRCDQIGLITHHDAWEYPVWVIARSFEEDVYIQDVLAANISDRLQANFMPCAIISMRADPGDETAHLGRVFVKSYESEFLSLFLPSMSHLHLRQVQVLRGGPVVE